MYSIINASLMVGSVPNGFTTAMEKVFTKGYWELPTNTPNFGYNLLLKVMEHKPDVVFIQIQQEGILAPYYAKECARFSFLIQYSGDVRHTTPYFYKDLGQNIQLTAFSNMVDVKNCINDGIKSEYLEIGFDPEIYKKRNIPKTKDIVCMFNNYSGQFPLSDYRVQIVHKLKSHFKERFYLFGFGWGGIESGNFNNSQLEEALVYNSSKIAINCSHFDFERYASDRMLRILGSGTMCLSHNYNSIETDYTIGKDLDIFNNLDELIEKCEFYLINTIKAEELADSGNKLVHNEFTFLKMAENIKSLYEAHKQ